MPIQRILYAAQSVRLHLKKDHLQSGGERVYLLPVSTASADETIPQEDMLVLGKLGAVARSQKDVASCKASIKAYIADSMTTVAFNPEDEDAVSVGVFGNTLGLGTLLQRLRDDAIGGFPVHIYCKANDGNNKSLGEGFEFVGLPSSIGIDVSKGAFPTLDLGFDGIGTVQDMDMGGDSNEQSAGENYISECIPVTSEHVKLIEWTNATAGEEHAVDYGWDDAASGKAEANVIDQDTVASVKFSLDMPTEVLSKVGGIIEGASDTVSVPASGDVDGQGVFTAKTIKLGGTPYITADNMIFSKPPYKASLTFDGQSLTELGLPTTHASGTYDSKVTTLSIGGSDGTTATIQTAQSKDNPLNVSISSAAAISTRSINQNVGDVGASFSITVEGTDATFASKSAYNAGTFVTNLW